MKRNYNQLKLKINHMSNKRTLRSETFYHIYNRGYNKQQLFFEDLDFQRFYNNFQRYKADEKYQNIKIKAFCFLPNHFHLLVWDDGKPAEISSLDSEENLSEPGVRISEFMNRIQLSCAMHFNKKYGDKIKKGLKSPVFEGRFKAKEITDEAYLSQVHTYIEHNAVKHEIVKTPEDWPYSSYSFEGKSNMDFDFNDSEFDPWFE